MTSISHPCDRCNDIVDYSFREPGIHLWRCPKCDKSKWWCDPCRDIVDKPVCLECSGLQTALAV